MKCLVVGGTGVLGSAIANALMSSDHETTILSRGNTTREKTKNMEALCADRHEDLSVLEDREFDWVFDTCAFTPDAVNKLLDAAGPKLKRYVLISSISAYGTFEKRNLTEDGNAITASPEDLAIARAVAVSDRSSGFAYGSAYGPLKRACEIAAIERLGTRATALRAGLLVGVGDYTNRLTWWVRRIDEARGDRRHIPVPGPANRCVQFIDVLDVAAFALSCADNTLGGVLNVTSPPILLTTVLDEIVRIADSEAEFIMVDEQSVLKSDIKPWTEIPLMSPIADAFRYFQEIDTVHAKAAGLKCRPLEMTLRPLLDWDRGRREITLKAGMSTEQEETLLRSRSD